MRSGAQQIPDVLLEVASLGAYRPLWSSEILAELDRVLRRLLAKRGASPQESDAYLVKLFGQMQAAFPDAVVTDWESFVRIVQVPDQNDRHVVAAALAGRADAIVTDNLIDFPPSALPASLARLSMDDFLLDLLDLHPALVVSAIRAVASRTGRFGVPQTALDIALYLRTHGTPTFGESLLAKLEEGSLA